MSDQIKKRKKKELDYGKENEREITTGCQGFRKSIFEAQNDLLNRGIQVKPYYVWSEINGFINA